MGCRARYERYARLSAGLLPIALGVEDSFSDESRSLVGYPSFASFLSGRTDLAVELDGELAEGLLSYDLSYAFGEGFDRFGQRRGDPQIAGRAVSYPLRFVDAGVDVGPYHLPLLSGFFVSFGYAWLFDYDAHLDVATPLRNKLFDTERLDGRSGETWDLGFGVDFGPLRIVHETVKGGISDLLLPSGIREDIEHDEITSWHVLVAWRITGEPYDSRPFRQRDCAGRRRRAGRSTARARQPGWGAFELAVRYANGDIDRDLQTFGLIAINPSVPRPENFRSSQEFRDVHGRAQLGSDRVSARLGRGRARARRSAPGRVRLARPRHLGSRARAVRVLIARGLVARACRCIFRRGDRVHRGRRRPDLRSLEPARALLGAHGLDRVDARNRRATRV